MRIRETAAPYSTTGMAASRQWSLRSLAVLVAAWLVLQVGGLFTPGLLDDVDSIYIQVAREMLQRHDYVTPTIDGIRFFDKPPLMYWMAAGSMRVFGVHDWAARLPLALGVLVLLLSVYALGIRLFRAVSPVDAPDRGGLYAALATATSLGVYLYTRFYIPDIWIALWMTLSVHLSLIALERVEQERSALLPAIGFGAVMAVDVLTKGLIGVIFPVGFVLLYLLVTRRLHWLLRLQVPAATMVFFVLAAPWHILAALRNPAIAMPPGVGLPARAGWAWFYLYNEHVARFLGKRIPHDYGNVPRPLFWLYLLLWLLPWVAFLPAALIDAVRVLREKRDAAVQIDSDMFFNHHEAMALPDRRYEAAVSLLLWAGIVLGFFTVSARQEYYHLPALPALALLVGGFLASADGGRASEALHQNVWAARQALRSALYFLVPLGVLLFGICGWLAITAPRPQQGVTLNALLNTNPDMYNLSLGHVFDLTTVAMGLFRGPLWAVAAGMLVLGPVAWLVRRRGHTLAANLLIATAMTVVLLGAHEGLRRFYPILGSKDLALRIEAARRPGDIVMIDGELTAGSTLLFYTATPAPNTLLVNGHVNGPWFGSFWPDAPHIFANDGDLRRMWAGPRRVFLLTYQPQQREADLRPLNAVVVIAKSGGKTVLSSQASDR